MWAKVGELLLHLIFGPLYFFFRMVRMTVFLTTPRWRHRTSEFEHTEIHELLEGGIILSIFVVWAVGALIVATLQGLSAPIPIVPVTVLHFGAGLLVYLVTRRKRVELVRRGVSREPLRT